MVGGQCCHNTHHFAFISQEHSKVTMGGDDLDGSTITKLARTHARTLSLSNYLSLSLSLSSLSTRSDLISLARRSSTLKPLLGDSLSRVREAIIAHTSEVKAKALACVGHLCIPAKSPSPPPKK